MVIGWRQFDNVNSNFRQAGYAFSSDSGQTWTFQGVINPGMFRSDPVLDHDSIGNFFYNSLTYDNASNLYLCKVFKSINGGAAWDTGADAQGGDKQWMTIDRSGGVGTGNIYSFWSSNYSSCYPGFFTRSTDGGNSFENCTAVDGNPFWGTMAVGPDGELYIAGSGLFAGIVVVKSTVAQTPGSIISWDFSTQVNMNGYLNGFYPINPAGLIGQANIDVDRSNGPGRGNVYVMASMVSLISFDSADVMFARSTDGGVTWDDPVRINDDSGTDHFQWFGTMSVAPNGRIDAAWLDTRDAPPGTYLSALYYSYSLDQGETWSVNEKLSNLFDPKVGYPQQEKMGDYIDMESDENGAHLAWANTLNGEQDVYYSYIVPDITGIADKGKKMEPVVLTAYPNPFTDQTNIRYKIPVACSVKIDICTIYGEVIKTIVDKWQPGGPYTIKFSESLPEGFYFCRLTAGIQIKTTSLIRIK
jgi:hypothetical protein